MRIGQAGGRLVFWRGQSYLPYWQTAAGRWSLPEVISRRGDGSRAMPDRVNSYSHVQIIRQQPDRVLVHWRYLPKFGGTNPHTGVDATKFAEESFLVTNEGHVTRTIRQGTKKYADWNDSRNTMTQELQLSASGIELFERAKVSRSTSRDPVQGNPVQQQMVARPSRYWRFDEGVGDTTAEGETGQRSEIAGHKALWKQGVSGTALELDGYNTLVEWPAATAPRINTALTLEGWVAIAAYPWNWAPIIHRGDDDGYFLGIDGHGRPGLKVKVGGQRFELVADKRLQRNRWYHVAGAFDGATGQAKVFVDGQAVVSRTMARGSISAPDGPVQIGKGKDRRPVDPVRANTFIDSYSLDGLIDEVRIYDTALSPKLIARSYQLFHPGERVAVKPDLDYRLLPQADTGGKFGAVHTHLRFYESWDVLWRFGDYPDVVVGFDTQPTQFVFWRGTGFIPMMVNEKQQWYSNEFNETWGRSGGQGCQEPMSDKEAYTNYVRVLENTGARVVVHWRYPLQDVLHVRANYDEQTGWCDYSDWYYTIYPDGVAVKRMRLWTRGPRNHEWQESMAILGPNQHPEQVINTDPALVLADLDGNASAYKWTDGPPRGVNYDNKKIHLVKYKAEYSPFTIGDFTGGDVYAGEVTDYSVFPCWNHWPVTQMPSDGRYASFPDRATHSSLTHVQLPDYRADHGDRPFQEKTLMEGMTNKSAQQLAVLARSWLSAPELRVVGGCRSAGYQQTERAYHLAAANRTMTFRVMASPDRPLLNPCFEISDWSCSRPATLSIGGRERPAGSSFRQGVVRDSNGRRKMIVWIELEATTPITFTIGGAQPALSTSPTRSLQWARQPPIVDGKLEVTMQVKPPSDGERAEYWFEGTSEGGDRHDSGWVTATSYADQHVLPNTNSDIALFADGRRVGTGRLQVGRFPEFGLPLKIGYCNEDFPSAQMGFVGQIRDVRWFGYGLTGERIQILSAESRQVTSNREGKANEGCVDVDHLCPGMSDSGNGGSGRRPPQYCPYHGRRHGLLRPRLLRLRDRDAESRRTGGRRAAFHAVL